MFPACPGPKMKPPKAANQRRHEKPREVPLFMAPPPTVAPVSGVPIAPTPMETNQLPPPQNQPPSLLPVLRKPWTGNYHTWQLETRKLYKEYKSGEVRRFVYPDGAYADLRLLTARRSDDHDTIQMYDQQTTTRGESYICKHPALPEYAYIRTHWARARALPDQQRNRTIANLDTGLILMVEPNRRETTSRQGPGHPPFLLNLGNYSAAEPVIFSHGLRILFCVIHMDLPAQAD